ncbi:Endonuclease/exonuclease/phosphatase [Lipomyces kononenkoae]
MDFIVNHLFDYFQRSTFTILLLSETGRPSADEIAIWDIELSHRGCRGLFTESAYKRMLTMASLLLATGFSNTLAEEYQERCADVVFYIEDSPTLIMAVYAPTDTARRASFFTAIMEATPALRYRQHIWGGDWNCVHCPEIDAAHIPATPDRTPDILETILNTLQAGDTFRLLYTYRRRFTNTPPTGAGHRLDRIYVSGAFLDSFSQATIHLSPDVYFSTHVPISASFAMASGHRRDSNTFRLCRHNLALPWVQQ